MLSASPIFLCACAHDITWLRCVHVHLKPLGVDPWDETRIQAGLVRQHEIRRALAAARVAVLLISAEFLAADFVVQGHLSALLLEAERGGLVILPLLLSPSLYTTVNGLAQIQPVNPLGDDANTPGFRTLSSLDEHERDLVLVKLAERIGEILTRPMAHSLDESLASEAPYGESDAAGQSGPIYAAPANFYVGGGPVLEPTRFFGRKKDRRRLFGLLGKVPLQNAAIIGPRRSGKTSLIHYLKCRPAMQDDALRPDQRGECSPSLAQYRFVTVNFQDPRLYHQHELLLHLLEGLGWPGGKTATVDLVEFMRRVEQYLSKPAVVLLDEIGVALGRNRESLDDTFWDGMRALVGPRTRGRLGFVVAAHESPRELSRRQGLGSPFFNIFGYTATLGPLSEEEARDLIGSAARRFDEADVVWILKESRRWPILLQVLCRERLQALEDGEEGEGWREEGLRQMEPYGDLLGGV